MNIAFDAKRAVQNNTGLGNYSRYVISVLSHFYPHNRYLLFSPGKKESARLQELKSKRNFDFILPKGIWKIFSGSWRTFGITSILKQKSIDIYHGLSQELPYGIKKTGVKSIVTIHDLIFVRYPGHYNLIEQFIHWWKIKKYRYASHQADKIIAVSECTKRDVVSFFKIHPDKIAVVYQGCHPVFSYPMSPEKKAAIIKKYRLPARFILYVGSIVTRKNLLLIVRSLLEVDQNVCLIAVGQKSSYQQKVEKFIKQNRLSDRVFIYNDVPFEDLPAFYHLASVFILPSFYEGFGIPVIEALSSGLPVIAASGSCLEEAGGENSIYIDPNDPQALAKQIKRVLNEPQLASAMSEKGKQYVSRFSDEKTAQNLLHVYEQVIKDNSTETLNREYSSSTTEDG